MILLTIRRYAPPFICKNTCTACTEHRQSVPEIDNSTQKNKLFSFAKVSNR